MNKVKILLADDDLVFCRLAGALLSGEGYDVHTATNTQQALNLLAEDEFDLIMLDLCFPALVDGFAMLEQVRRDYPQLKVLMISGSGNVPNAVRAIQNGAADFIVKPIEPEHLLLRIQSLTESIILDQKLKQLEHKAIGMVGVSAEMQKVFTAIIAAAKLEVPVLVTGETGVGKELACRAVHRLSNRGMKELVCVNSANIPANLYYSGLQGKELETQKQNLELYTNYLNSARESSLLLDEICEMPPGGQDRLNSFLLNQENGLDTLGDVRLPRLISATNRDLLHKVNSGGFREDLYYRISEFHIHIPPLRQRRDDIIPLTLLFIREYCQLNDLISKDVSQKAQLWLTEQDWEGNVRQLKHSVGRALLLSDRNVLEPEDFVGLPLEQTPLGEKSGTLRDRMMRYEVKVISQHLKACNNNLTQTAKLLGIDKSNLSKKIRTLGIDFRD